MKSSGFERRLPLSHQADPTALRGLSAVSGSGSPSEEHFCYVLDVSRVVGAPEAAVREGMGAQKDACDPQSHALCPWETFICRSYERAKELMMDSDFLPTDWISCHCSSDSDGKIVEVFLSTGGKFLARISRTELF